MKSKILSYLIVILLCLVAWGLFVFFLYGSMNVDPNPDGNFIIPGDSVAEWAIAILSLPFLSLIGAIIGLFIVSKIYLRLYIKIMTKKSKIGLVSSTDLKTGALLKKFLGRSVTLAFFVCNIAYSLASQEVIIEWMRSVNPPAEYLIPDPEVMYMLIFIILVPAMLIIVPLWFMNDLGLVSIKSVKGFKLEEVDLASTKIYRIIKGYAGIGFLYNLGLLIVAWALPGIMSGHTDPLGVIMQIISPLVTIFLLTPAVLAIDGYHKRAIRKLEQNLRELNLNKRFSYEFGFEDISDFESKT